MRESLQRTAASGFWFALGAGSATAEGGWFAIAGVLFIGLLVDGLIKYEEARRG